MMPLASTNINKIDSIYILLEKIVNLFSNNAIASRDEKVGRRACRPGSGKGKRECKEELWERRENCKTTYRATAHAERIIPRCGLKPRAIWPHAIV